MRLHYSQFSLENVLDAMDNLWSSHPQVDLVVTPEYLFYGAGDAGREYRDDPVVVDCHARRCKVSSIGTPKSDEIQQAIEAIRKVAAARGVNIVLGTVAEAVSVEGMNLTLNTQLIIDRHGAVVGKHQKYGIIYFRDERRDACDTHPDLCQRVNERILETLTSFSLRTSKGIRFTILPIICGEKATPQVIERLRGRQQYLVVSSDIDRDFDYEDFTLRIQAGEDPFGNAPVGSPEWLFKTVFIDPWMRAGAMRRDGYLLVSDSGLPKVGLISMGLTPIEGLEISEGFLYGTIPTARDFPVSGEPAVGGPASIAEP